MDKKLYRYGYKKLTDNINFLRHKICVLEKGKRYHLNTKGCEAKIQECKDLIWAYLKSRTFLIKTYQRLEQR